MKDSLRLHLDFEVDAIRMHCKKLVLDHARDLERRVEEAFEKLAPEMNVGQMLQSRIEKEIRKVITEEVTAEARRRVDHVNIRELVRAEMGKNERR